VKIEGQQMKSPNWRYSHLTAVMLCGALLAWHSAACSARDVDVGQKITRAGNCEDEHVRYQILREVAALPGLDEEIQRDLEGMLPILDCWANNTYRPQEPRKRAAENGFLCGFFTGKVRPDRYLLPRIKESSPLYPIWCLYRGRMLIHQVIQSGNLRHSRKLREAWCGEGRRLLRVAQQAFPENRIIGMYLDQPLAGWPQERAPDEHAPEWANLQRECLEKLAQIIDWWIDHRQLENGEFGGGWGDDCEMWRWWSPIMIAFEDPKITEAQARFSQGLFGQAHMEHGYTTYMSDVEHTAEDTKDTITPMLHLRPEDARWGHRALRIADLMETVWTGTNERGTLQFKGTYFNVHEVHSSPQRACDTVWHPGVVQPTMLLWLRTRDQRLTHLFSAWMDTWVDVTARAERGKPAGIIPSAIHWPSGRAGGSEEPWYYPNIDRQAHLYDWPGNMTMLTSTLLLTHHITRDPKYLQPIHSMAEIRRTYLADRNRDEEEPGNVEWCARRMGFLVETLAKYRALSQDTRYDDMLLREANGYVRFRLTGQREKLTQDLLRQARALRVNWPGYTSEVRWTDRVLSFTGNYLNDYAQPPLPRVDPAFLYATVTGDLGRVDYLPLNAVRWLTKPKDIAVLVTSSGSDHLEAELYHFGKEGRNLAAELYLLEQGTYAVTLETADRVFSHQQAEIAKTPFSLELQLPPRQLCRLKLRKPENPSRPHYPDR
jgi:hypothetical protein